MKQQDVFIFQIGFAHWGIETYCIEGESLAVATDEILGWAMRQKERIQSFKFTRWGTLLTPRVVKIREISHD